MEYQPSPQPSPFGRGSQEEEKEENKYHQQDKSCSPLPEGEGLGVRAEILKLAGSNRQIPKVLLERARKLRKQQTPAEEILWECLRNRRLLNTKFRRQHNIGRYITDFYCHEKLLIIELDGSIHANQQAEDFIRENWLKSNQFTVIRFSNEQIFNDIELVLHSIAQALIP
ncbi:endonuclease domain-containing protein [Nostoc sp.]|uniref:endonuclease domain-containing protein n=1 Tax=Nostoc sp. TaxID=1180 RepID=UPI002FF62C7D